jgi:hypothetical protein
VVTRSSSFPIGAFRSRHQALRASRADAVRSFGSHASANVRGKHLPVTGDAAHTPAPGALRDPEGIVTANTAGRHRARGRSLIGGPMVHIERRGARSGTLRVGPCLGDRPDVVSDRLQKDPTAVE